jgi:hypothetical protein
MICFVCSTVASEMVSFGLLWLINCSFSVEPPSKSSPNFKFVLNWPFE